MTQQRWNTLDGWECMAGWDRPLSYYFFQVSKRCDTCKGLGTIEEDEECGNCDGRGEIWVYDNLDDISLPPAGGMTLQQVKDRLEQYLTEWPQPLLPTLVEERQQNIGNKITSYDPVGRVKPR